MESLWNQILLTHYSEYNLSISFVNLDKNTIACVHPHSPHTIFVNKRFEVLSDSETSAVKNCLAHEIAHILRGSETDKTNNTNKTMCKDSKHDDKWKQTCIKLGGTGNVEEAIISSDMCQLVKNAVEIHRKNPHLDGVTCQKMAADELLKTMSPDDVLNMYLASFS